MTDSITLRRRPQAVAQGIQRDLPDVLKQILASRGIRNDDDLDHSLRRLIHFDQLKDIGRAAERLAEAIENQESICIAGDFDADGATSVAMLMDALPHFGATTLFYLVPNRFADGYGLTPGLVQVAAEQGANLIITVDNGISSHEGIKQANSLGIDVIVTDHHLQGAELPPAYAVVNPNRHDCSFPEKSLAGVGVAFYLLMALRNWYRESKPDKPGASVNIAQWLDLVAVGTVADVVSLERNNRVLVTQGLARIKSGACRPGIQALLKASGRSVDKLKALDLGFTIGPRINAAGRLEDMQAGIECLRAKDDNQALMLAMQLDQLNKDRREIQQQMQQEAEHYLNALSLHDVPPVLAIHKDSWHQGVIGILAGRLKEQLYRPVIAFAPGESGELKGSARSVRGIHIRDLLAQVASESPGSIIKFGGHAMAAGLSVSTQRWHEFCETLDKVAREWVEPDVLNRVLWSDGELPEQLISVEFASQLEHAFPWGQGFEEPLFDGVFRVEQSRWLKEKHLKLVVSPQSGGRSVDAIAFNFPPGLWQQLTGQQRQVEVRLVYKLQVNEFRGEETPQLLVEHVLSAQ